MFSPVKMNMQCADAPGLNRLLQHRGVFGCHTAFVLRRLRRLCERFYNAHPTFVVTSATVANPKEHVQELLGNAQPATLHRSLRRAWTPQHPRPPFPPATIANFQEHVGDA